MNRFGRSWARVAPAVPVAKRTCPQGRVFHSRAEMVWYLQLELKEREGLIRGLQRQVRYPLVMQVEDELREIVIRSPGFPNGRVAVYTLDAMWQEPDAPAPLTRRVTPLRWRTVYAEFKGHDDMPGDKLRRAVFECIYRVRVTLFGPAAKKQQRAMARKAQGLPIRRNRQSKQGMSQAAAKKNAAAL